MQLMTDLVGRTLSQRYRLTARLSSGHLGDVYEAEDAKLKRTVALKVLPHSLSIDVSVVDRFRAEASAVARLTHPNIVSVYDWGNDAGTFYMVMERIPSTDLRDLLVAQGALAPAQAADLMAQVCDALNAAHRSGLVHRALKPENILLTEEGIVKVADFGLAIVAPREDPSSSGMSTSVRYMAPEQALGFDASPTSDIWAAGAILSEMLTARPPLQGAGVDLLEKRSHEEPVAPSEFDSAIPADLDDIVLQACALDPANRFHEASDMANALRRAGVRSLPAAPPVEELVGNITSDTGDQVEAVDTHPFVKEVPGGRHAKRKLKLRFGRILLTFLLLLALVAGASYAGFVVLAPEEVPVPDVVKLTPADARERLDQDNIEVVVVERVHDTKVPKGHIISQDPQNGVLTEGQTLEVLVSSGRPDIEVPSVEGNQVNVARKRLKNFDFKIGRVLRRHSLKADKGVVLKQLPDKGKLEWGSKVHLVLSKGPPPVRVPNLVGELTVGAINKLEREGLKPRQVDVYSDTVASGLVISTEPKAGKILHVGDKIKVVNSLGPEFERIEIPAVWGEPLGDALAQLSYVGLDSNAVQGASCTKKEMKAPGKTALDTAPEPGNVVWEYETVTVYYC